MTKTFYFYHFPDRNVNILEGIPNDVTSIDVTYIKNGRTTNYPITGGLQGLAKYMAVMNRNRSNINNISKISVNWPTPVLVNTLNINNMNKFPIESGIPIPAAKTAKKPKVENINEEWRKNFRKMKVNDSFFVETPINNLTSIQARLMSCAYNFRKSEPSIKVFSTRTERKGNTGVRIWRLK